MGQIERITKLLFRGGLGWEGDDNGRPADKNSQARIKNGVVVGLPEEPEDEPCLVDPPTPEAAEGHGALKEEQTSQEEDDQTQPEDEREKIKPGRLPKAARFWDHLEAIDRSPQTIQSYKYEMAWWRRRALAQAQGRTIYTLRAADIEASLKKIHPSTARRKIAFLRSLSRFYLRESFPRLHTELQKITSPRIPQRLPRDLGAEAFIQLREQAKVWCGEGKRVGIWTGSMVMAGLRISEVETLEMASTGNIRVLGNGNK